MTIEELIGPELIAGLREHQLQEILEAHMQDPDAVARVWRRAKSANNPTAALIAMVRKIGAVADEPARAWDLDAVVGDALRLYNARTAKYPPNDEPGWTEADAIVYAVDVACLKHSRFASDDIERALRIRIGRAWSPNQDPALHAPGGSPPELLDNILNKVGRIGSMPDNKSEAQMLAERLRRQDALKVVADPVPTTQSLAERLLATLGG